jgi:NADH-quinone oxidoreductase subunit L
MKFPLIILAVLSCAAGFIGIPEFIMGTHGHGAHLNLTVAACSVLAAGAGIALGTFMYKKSASKKDPLVQILGWLHEVLIQKYYLDFFFSKLARFFQELVAKVLFWFDRDVIIQKGVNGTAFLTSSFASFLRRAQTGSVQTYAISFSLGVIALVYFFLMRGH